MHLEKGAHKALASQQDKAVAAHSSINRAMVRPFAPFDEQQLFFLKLAKHFLFHAH